MNIYLNDIFKITNLEEYKLHTARANEDNIEPLDVFVTNFDDWKKWNMWRRTIDEFNRKYIISLIDFKHEKGMWLFGGVFEIINSSKTNNSHSYEIEEVMKFSPYIGRLKLYLPKHSRGRSFRLENHIDKIIVSEVLKTRYTGESFPGLENINHSFNDLKLVFKHQFSDWKSSLNFRKGVYLITDKENGKRYVGAAYGDDGIWSRWNDYIINGHGFNKELVEVISLKGLQYAEENFIFSLLESYPMKVDDDKVIIRETYWKKVLLTRTDYGYNKN